MKKLAALSAFVSGYVIVNQIGYLIVQWLCERADRWVTAYVSAFTFFMLPHGLFAVSIITALLPEHRSTPQRPMGRFRDVLGGVRATALSTFPPRLVTSSRGADRSDLLEHGVMTDRSIRASRRRAPVLRHRSRALLSVPTVPRGPSMRCRTPRPLLDQLSVAVGLNAAVNIPMFAWLGVEGRRWATPWPTLWRLVQGRVLASASVVWTADVSSAARSPA